jgi:predicted restriction endonuclease
MPLADITREGVLRAVAEFDRLGRDRFLEQYGFGRAKQYFLIHAGRPYDSKAIAGAAHGFDRPNEGPLRSADFSGGESTVRRRLTQLDFRVERLTQEPDGTPSPGNSGLSSTPAGPHTSDRLDVGRIYTREELARAFGIADATLNTGIFRPKGSKSIWLFVTEKKTADRTQYADRLVGDDLHWQGQTAGRTDRLIIEHEARGLELLVFYRLHKSEHPGAGFRYESRFRYVDHRGSKPTTFSLRRVNDALSKTATKLAASGGFDPSNLEDARERTLAAIVQRRGQAKFRRDLLAAYNGRCAISGWATEDVLEAAHIVPYLGEATNHVANGLLLRADLRTLFDLGLLAVDPRTLRVIVAQRLRRTPYGRFHGRPLRCPANESSRPNRDALQRHLDESALAPRHIE